MVVERKLMEEATSKGALEKGGLASPFRI
jgi:hypothetical protein